jgi:hypothetical protein
MQELSYDQNCTVTGVSEVKTLNFFGSEVSAAGFGTALSFFSILARSSIHSTCL